MIEFILIALLLGLGFLILPLALELKMARLAPEALELHLDGGFFWGLFGFRLEIHPPLPRLFPLLLGRPLTFLAWHPGPTEGAGREEPLRPPRRFRFGPSIGSIRRLWRPNLRLLTALPRLLTLRRLDVRGTFGFEDPAHTGSVFGYLQSLRPFVGHGLKLELTPDFVRTGFWGHLELRADLHLGLLLFLGLRFGLQIACRWLAKRLRRRDRAMLLVTHYPGPRRP